MHFWYRDNEANSKAWAGVFVKLKILNEAGFERIGTYAIKHVSADMLTKLERILFIYRNHGDCPIFPIMIESFQPGNWLSQPRLRAMRSE